MQKNNTKKQLIGKIKPNKKTVIKLENKQLHVQDNSLQVRQQAQF